MDGSLTLPKTLCRRFSDHVKKRNLPRLTFRGLRHTHAALLLVSGAHPKVVQERLGHSTVAITLDLYGHVLPELQRSAADSMTG